MLNRFNSPDVGEQLLRRADHLKINLYRDTDGDLHTSFELSGDTAPNEDDSLDGAIAVDESPLRFLAALMKRFQEKDG